MRAARDGSKEIVEMLIKNGADVNLQSLSGWTALVYACKFENIDIAQVLLENGALVNLQDSTGNTALGEACWHGREDIVKLLLKYGADTTIKNNDGKTPYDIAKGNNYIDICEMLEHAEYYKDIDEKNADVEMKSEEETKAAVSRLVKRLRGV